MTVIADIAALPPALFLREEAAFVREGITPVPPFQEPQTVQRPTITSGKLKLEADRVRYVPATNLTELQGNVVATYEGATLSSQDAEINHETKQGWFRNTVKLVDQLGTMTASEIFIDWSHEKPDGVSGHAKNIILDAYEAHFEAEELQLLKDGSATLKKAWFSTAASYYRLILDDVVIKPGEFVSAKRAVFQLGKGLRIPIPFFRVNLNPRVTGFQTPVPKIDEDFKLGYSWAQVIELGPRATFHFNQRGGQDKVPTVNSQLTYEIKQPLDARNRLLPRNEDQERFQQGYFDNVNMGSLEQEADEIGKPHAIAFIGHTMNINTKARPGDAEDLDRPYYAGVQGGSAFGGVSLLGQLRYGLVKERLSEVDHHRAEFIGTALVPGLNLGPHIALRFRADLAMFTGEGADFGWLRPLAAIVVTPAKEVTLGVAYFRAQEWGSPLFDADRLFSKNGLHFRMDLDLAATDLSVLLKYDFDRGDVYDIEFALEQVMPVIRPFVSYRSFPGSIAFGFTLRADDLLNALKRRNILRDRVPQR